MKSISRQIVLLTAAALLVSLSCRANRHPREASFTVDLLQRIPGEVRVLLLLPGEGRSPIVLRSAMDKASLRISRLEARQGGAPLPVEAEDSRRWRIGPARGSGPVLVEYVVHPGTVVEERNSGPTGYRLGYLDREFGLFTGRQLFLLPQASRSPDLIKIRFLTAGGLEVVAPWKPARQGTGFEIRGAGSAAELTAAVLGFGGFEQGVSSGGEFSVHVSLGLPPEIRKAARDRALKLHAELALRLGPCGPYQLILVPKSPEGMLISAAPTARGQGLSLGEGIPTRWTEMGASMGRACLESSGRGSEISAGNRWILEGLPLYLTILHGEKQGWRSRREWMEQFYYELAGAPADLPMPAKGGEDPMTRERRGALVLDRLSGEMRRAGLPPLEESLGKALNGKMQGGVDRFLAEEVPARLLSAMRQWLDPASVSIPFPDVPLDEKARILALPPEIPRRGRMGVRMDLYLGGRNLGLLEQCGCRSKQVGGFARRSSLLKRRLKANLPSLVLELGDAVPFDSASPLLDRQKEAESDLSFALLKRLGAHASIVGTSELAYGPRFLAGRVAALPAGFRLLSVNVSGAGLELPGWVDFRFRSSSLRLFGAADRSSYRLGRALEFEDATSDLIWIPPGEALEGKPGIGPGRRLTAVAGPLGPSEALKIQNRFPAVSLILTDDFFRFGRDPRISFQRPQGEGFATLGMLGRTLLVVLKSDSYALVRLGLLLGRDGEIQGAELEDLPLDETVPDDPAVRAILDRHYETLARESGLSEATPVGSRLEGSLDADYIGESACAACHSEEAESWRSTPHAAAFASILERHRQGVPACVSCHVTGYGQPTGYRRIEDQALRHVQCESCHGPGSRHLALPVKGTILRVPEERDCRECHDSKHSEMNDGNFPEYWARIAHHGPAPER